MNMWGLTPGFVEELEKGFPEFLAGLKEGDEIDVKLIGVDPKTNKLKLSRKALLPKPEGYVERERRPRPERGERGERRDRGERRERHEHKEE